MSCRAEEGMDTTSNKLDLHGLSWSFGRAVYLFIFFSRVLFDFGS